MDMKYFCSKFYFLWVCIFHIFNLFCNQGSDRPGKAEKPGKLRELTNASGKSGKTWKTQGILFECNYFGFVQTLIGVSHVHTSFFDHFVIFVLIVCIFIFIMQLPFHLNDVKITLTRNGGLSPVSKLVIDVGL